MISFAKGSFADKAYANQVLWPSRARHNAVKAYSPAGVPKMVRLTYRKKIRPRSTLLHDSSPVAWREHPSSGHKVQARARISPGVTPQEIFVSNNHTSDYKLKILGTPVGAAGSRNWDSETCGKHQTKN